MKNEYGWHLLCLILSLLLLFLYFLALPWSLTYFFNLFILVCVHTCPFYWIAQLYTCKINTGVCIIDDDRFYTNIDDLEFGFTVWQVCPCSTITSTLYMPWIYVSLYNNMTLVLCNTLILRTLDTESLVMKSGLIHISRMVLSIMVFIQARNIILAIQWR